MTLERAVLDGRSAWRDAWRRTDPLRRSRIKTAVHTGNGLSDPEDAALAVGLARRAGRRWWLAPFTVGHGPVNVWSWRKSFDEVEAANLRIAEGAFSPR